MVGGPNSCCEIRVHGADGAVRPYCIKLAFHIISCSLLIH